MRKVKALLLPVLLAGFTGSLSAQTVFDFDFSGAGVPTVTGTFDATPSVTLPGAGSEYLINSVSIISGPSPVALLGTGGSLPNDNLLLPSTGVTFQPTNSGIGLSYGGNNYLLNEIGTQAYLSQYTPGSSTPNFTDPVTFSAVKAPWEPSDAVAIIGVGLFGLAQYRKRRKLAA
jgi:hypothetical protein